MKLSILKAMLPATALIAFTGCMDDKYDLDDLDTTSRIPINDLTIPVNLKDIALDDVIKLTDNDNIVVSTDADGKKIYALSKSGELTSDDIVIKAIEVKAEEINPTSVTINSVSVTLPNVGINDVIYQIEDMESSFSYNALDVDDAVRSLAAIETAQDAHFDVIIHIPSDLATDKMVLHNMKIHYPRGMYLTDGSAARSSIGTYDPETGDVTIDRYEVRGNSLKITLTSNRFDLTKNEVSLDENQHFEFKGTMGVLKEGHVVLTPASGSRLPSSITFSADYDMNHFYIKNFDGYIDYKIKGLDIEPITFDDLPDFLKSSDTRIFLANPQIYLSTKNTTAHYNTEASSAIRLTSHFRNGSSREESSETFFVDSKLGPDAIYNIMLSPDGQATVPQPEYAANIHNYTFAGLGDILAAEDGPDGLPQSISAELLQSHFFGNAKGFPVEVPGFSPEEYTITGLRGSYCMFAPLAFDPETRIIYNKVDDGWESEDLDGLEINRFVVNAHAATTIDMQVILTVYPIDSEGNKMGRSYPITLPPMANQDIELVIETEPDSPIKCLGGIEYHAVVEQTGDDTGKPLGPDETIALTNIKIKVSGSYTKEL